MFLSEMIKTMINIKDSHPISRSIFIKIYNKVSSVQLPSCVRLFATPWQQDTRLPCPSPTPGVDSNSCPSCQWCHPTISSSVVTFSSCLQSFPVSGSFPMNRFFESKYWSFSFRISPANEYSGPISFRWTGWISLQSKGLSRVSQFKSINSSVLSFLYSPTLTSIHDHWKNHSFD